MHDINSFHRVSEVSVNGANINAYIVRLLAPGRLYDALVTRIGAEYDAPPKRGTREFFAFGN